MRSREYYRLISTVKTCRVCKTCKRRFEASYWLERYCSSKCERATYKAPAVYRFICPDGRSYVGAVRDCRKRAEKGIARSNPWLEAAFKKYPPESWTYEILERLRPGCTKQDLREAEQRHMALLNSWDPEAGFNMFPAVWTVDSPARQRRCAQVRAWQRAWQVREKERSE